MLGLYDPKPHWTKPFNVISAFLHKRKWDQINYTDSNGTKVAWFIGNDLEFVEIVW